MNQHLDDTFTALADPTRRAVIQMLSAEPRSPSDIADALALTRPAISRHLRLLRKAGLVQEEIQVEDARIRLYSLKPELFRDVRSWLDEVEAFWTDQLHAFKLHAERGRQEPES